MPCEACDAWHSNIPRRVPKIVNVGLTDVILATYLTLVGGGIAALFWTRLNRIESRMQSFATREDLNRLETKVDACATREELSALRGEMAIMRSDLTQVALAVGARPRASGD